jgi:large subunit ribosomal protein L9
MRVILNKTVDRVGPVGSIVEVSNGYARNYLFPNNLAVTATESNIRTVEKIKAKDIQLEKEIKLQAEEKAKSISDLSLTTEVKAGEDDKLYGSVSTNDVQKLLADNGIQVERRDIMLKTPIRSIGAYKIDIVCYSGVRAPLKLWVVKKTE